MGRQVSGSASDTAKRGIYNFIIVVMTKCDPHLLCMHMPWRSYEVLGFSTVSTNWL